MVQGNWYMPSTEFEMVNGDSTDIRFYLGSTLLDSKTVTNFGIDSANNAGYIGIEKTESGFRNAWNGFFCSFNFSNNPDGMTLRDTQALYDSSSVWTAAFNQYENENGTKRSCHSSCDGIGCINGRPCRSDCQDGFEWCHLCLDYECQNCLTFDSCENGGCDQEATNSSNVCECLTGYVRISIDYECEQCNPACETCIGGGFH